MEEEFLAGIDLSKLPDTPQRPAGAPPACRNVTSGPEGDCWWTCGGCRRADDLVGCSGQATALTFDDGPSVNTLPLLDYLKQHKINATFCVLGSQVLQHPQILQRAFDEGHEICLHTWSHAALTTLTNEQILAEIKWTEKIVYETIGVTPRFLRPPYGDIDDRVRAVVKAAGYRILHWNLDSSDWKLSSPIPQVHVSSNTLVRAFRDAIARGPSKAAGELSHSSHKKHQGFITLEHDITQQSIQQFFKVPPLLRASGYALQTVSQCLPNEVPYREMLEESTVHTHSRKTASQSVAARPATTASAAGVAILAGALALTTAVSLLPVVCAL